MKHMNDPFPQTPEGFHRRVEWTLASLEEKTVIPPFPKRKAALLAAIIAALVTVTAVATVLGGTGFRDWLMRENLGDVAERVQEVHLGDTGAMKDGFAFSIDELIWEDGDLYVSYSMSVPGDGRYMVAVYTPTLNDERLVYDAKGFAAPMFFDRDDHQSTVLLLGGDHSTACNALLTFRADPRLRQASDNRLRFKAVLLKTTLDIEGDGSWDGVLDPPDHLTFDKDWHVEATSDELEGHSEAFIKLMDAAAKALEEGEMLTLDALTATGCVEYVATREIDMGLDATQLAAEVLYNNVAEHDFDRFGAHVHIDRFRMTHLGVEIECTVSAPDAKSLDDFLNLEWRFAAADGASLGYSLGNEGGGSRIVVEDGMPGWRLGWHESAILPLQGLDQILFAPCAYVDDPDGGNHPVFDMENAIM